MTRGGMDLKDMGIALYLGRKPASGKEGTMWVVRIHF